VAYSRYRWFKVNLPVGGGSSTSLECVRHFQTTLKSLAPHQQSPVSLSSVLRSTTFDRTLRATLHDCDCSSSELSALPRTTLETVVAVVFECVHGTAIVQTSAFVRGRALR
jgi:hypothetical protein